MKLHHTIIVISTAISTILGQSVSAQTESPDIEKRPAMIKAVTSKGVDTGTCLANPGDSVGGWILKPCNVDDPVQLFRLSRIRLTQGTTIANQTSIDGAEITVKCLAVLNTPTSIIKVNSLVAKTDCNIAGSSEKWLLDNNQLVLTDATPSTKTKFCLTANSSLGTRLRLGDCSQPATLTNWVVKFPRINWPSSFWGGPVPSLNRPK